MFWQNDKCHNNCPFSQWCISAWLWYALNLEPKLVFFKNENDPTNEDGQKSKGRLHFWGCKFLRSTWRHMSWHHNNPSCRSESSNYKFGHLDKETLPENVCTNIRTNVRTNVCTNVRTNEVSPKSEVPSVALAKIFFYNGSRFLPTSA